MKQITKDNLYIEYSPAVNDYGDYAYVRGGVGASKVVVNDRVVLDDGTFCSHLILTNECLLFSSSSLKQEKCSLYMYYLKTKKIANKKN